MGIAEHHMGGLKGQSLTNTAWVVAREAQSQAPLFLVLAKVAEQRVGNFNTQGPASTAWPFAAAGCESPTPTILDVNARYYSEALSARNDLTVFDAFHKVFKFAAGSQTFRPDQQGCPTATDAFQK